MCCYVYVLLIFVPLVYLIWTRYKKSGQMTTKVTLRRKPISKGRVSLYLDFYPAIVSPDTGEQTRRLFLGLYLYEKPKDIHERTHNKKFSEIAQQIKLSRENQLNKPEVYTEFEKAQLKNKELGEKDFTDYFCKIVEGKKGKSQHNWQNAYNHWLKFAGGSVRFADLTPEMCEGFRSYLLSARSLKSERATLGINSASLYFVKFRTVIKMAFTKDGFIQSNLNDRVSTIKMTETHRKYLTLEELNKLAKTECGNPLLKRAALFSALTGLRASDILKLKWGEIEYTEERGYNIKFIQQKTRGAEVLPISEQAVNLLGTPKDAGTRVFDGLKYSQFSHRHLYYWLANAGITKEITFHSFRHTYATLQLAAGTDIYTVSKMLGHKNLQSTQVYAKVVNKLKQEAANKIKLDI